MLPKRTAGTPLAAFYRFARLSRRSSNLVGETIEASRFHRREELKVFGDNSQLDHRHELRMYDHELSVSTPLDS